MGIVKHHSYGMPSLFLVLSPGNEQSCVHAATGALTSKL